MTPSEDNSLPELWALLAPYAEREDTLKELEKTEDPMFIGSEEGFEPTFEELMKIVGIEMEEQHITPLISTSRSPSIPIRPIFPSSTPFTTTTYLQAQAQDQGPIPFPIPNAPGDTDDDTKQGSVIFILLPLLIVLATLLFLLLVFLIAVIVTRRKKGIRLVEEGGPLDLSFNDGVPQASDGGIEGVEQRWLEQVDDATREGYRRGKDYQQQYPPSSLATDITLSQFLSIQEKGVSAWCFEPDYESNLSLYVESRTEITFLADGPGMPAREGGGNTVLANLPLPKLNEVYYWEAKMYEKPPGTEVVVGLATKPFPSFRLPGWSKVSVGYFSSDGFKCHNYPFTAASHGPPLAEGDVLGVGYRPRTGTVFFTRNGRKLDDCYKGLQAFNLFPAIGANGAATIHVNLGQAGFVFIEANVKKWGLAPMIGTLAPPPAYGSERGSILLDAGYGTPNARSDSERSLDTARIVAAARQMAGDQRLDHRPLSSSQGSLPLSGIESSSFPSQPIPGSPQNSFLGGGHRRTQSQRDRRPASMSGNVVPTNPSPLRIGSPSEAAEAGPSDTGRRNRTSRLREMTDQMARYHSPTDRPEVNRAFPSIVGEGMEVHSSEYDDSEDSDSDEGTQTGEMYGSNPTSPSESSLPHNPPTPNRLDISMHELHDHERSGSYFGGRGNRTRGDSHSGSSRESETTVTQTRRTHARNRSAWAVEQEHFLPAATVGDRPPPGYSPLDPHVYSDGVPTDLPAEVISQAFEAQDRADQQQRDAEAAANRRLNGSASSSIWTRLVGR